MRVVRSRADFTSARADLAGTVGLVPTMGALHAGHAALLTHARRDSDATVATIFVNPTQFDAADDLARYPRTLDADLALCEQAGVDLVWTPDVVDVYPHGGTTRVRVEPGALGDALEGEHRPGHFAGMLTVVAKLLNLVRPDRAYFGEKDYQQLTLVRQLSEDLELGCEIVGVPTVREADGLALSSRNVHLSPVERTSALALSRALRAGRDAASHGRAAVLAAARAELTDDAVHVEYLELCGADLGEPPEHGAARLLVAARVGATRLIDNTAVEL